MIKFCLFTLAIKTDLTECYTIFLYYNSSDNSVTRCFVQSFERVCPLHSYFRIRISLLNCIDHVIRMDCKRKVSQVFNNNPQEVDYEDDQNRDGGIMQKQTAVNAKLQTGKTDQTKGLTGRIPSSSECPHWTVLPLKKKKTLMMIMMMILADILCPFTGFLVFIQSN